MGLGQVKVGNKAPNEVNVIIEIGQGAAPVKYEVDKQTQALHVDRFLSTAMHYPCNYGYVPETLCDDGDPSDVLVITPFPLQAGVVISVRPIGMLVMTDEKGGDNKIVAVPTTDLTSEYDAIHQVKDLPEVILQRIGHFFEHYKDLESGKWVKIDAWLDADAAVADISQAMAAYQSSATSQS